MTWKLEKCFGPIRLQFQKNYIDFPEIIFVWLLLRIACFVGWLFYKSLAQFNELVNPQAASFNHSTLFKVVWTILMIKGRPLSGSQRICVNDHENATTRVFPRYDTVFLTETLRKGTGRACVTIVRFVQIQRNAAHNFRASFEVEVAAIYIVAYTVYLW